MVNAPEGVSPTDPRVTAIVRALAEDPALGSGYGYAEQRHLALIAVAAIDSGTPRSEARAAAMISAAIGRPLRRRARVARDAIIPLMLTRYFETCGRRARRLARSAGR